MSDTLILLLLLLAALAVFIIYVLENSGSSNGTAQTSAGTPLMNGRLYYIVPRLNANMVLTSAGNTQGSAVTLAQRQNVPLAKWKAERTSEGWWRFHMGSTTVLDGNNGYGAPLHVWGRDVANLANSNWILYSFQHTGYHAMYRVAGGVLGVNNFGTAAGTSLSVKEDYTGGPEQQFNFVPAH